MSELFEGTITDRPWGFVGGMICKAVVDVRGGPFVDLAEAARMAFARG